MRSGGGSGHAEEHRAEVHVLRGLEHARDHEQHVAHLGEPVGVRDRHPCEALVGEQGVAQAELVRARDLPLDAHPLEHLDAAELRRDDPRHGVLAVADGLAPPPDGERPAAGHGGVVEHGSLEVALGLREVDDLGEEGRVDLRLQPPHRAASDLALHLERGGLAARGRPREVVPADRVAEVGGLAARGRVDERSTVGTDEDAGERQLGPGNPGLLALARGDEAEGVGVEVAAATVSTHGGTSPAPRGLSEM